MSGPRNRLGRPPRARPGLRLAVTDGRETIGYVVEAGGQWQAQTRDGEPIGTYPTQRAASGWRWQARRIPTRLPVPQARQRRSVSGGVGPGDAFAAGLVFAARKGQLKIDARIARHVGEMLASNDPGVLRKGVALVARSDSLRKALRLFEAPGARVGGAQSSGWQSAPQQVFGASGTQQEG